MLVSSSGRADNEEQRTTRDLLIRSTLAGKYSSIAARTAPALLAPGHDHDSNLVQQVRDLAEAAGPEAFVAHLTAIRRRPDSFDLLPQIRTPTLIVAGNQDRVTPIAEQQAMAAAIPGANLHLLDICGHMPPLEQPVRLAAVITGFLKAQTGGSQIGQG